MKDQRQYSRASSSAYVELRHEKVGVFELKAKDISDGGLFVLLQGKPAFPVGTRLEVRIKRHTGYINQDPVLMDVVHHHADGMGLMFV